LSDLVNSGELSTIDVNSGGGNRRRSREGGRWKKGGPAMA